jgi:3-oxoadipate enol-lactonase
MSFVTIGVNTVHYEISGPEFAPTIVFANSLGTSLALWDEIVTAFAGSYRILRYDMRGHGLTDDPVDELTIDELADDALALMDVLRVAKAAFVGLSIGGLVGQAVAARAPERIAALALVATANRIGHARMWNDRIAIVRDHGVGAVVEGGLARWFTPRAFTEMPSVVYGFGNMLARTTALGYAACCAAVRDADLGAADATIRCPTLIVSGRHDAITPPADGEAMHAAIRNASFHVIENAAHLIAAERPRELAALLVPFLEAHHR